MADGEHRVRRNARLLALCAALYLLGAWWDSKECALKLLTNTETAEMIGLKPNTLEIWRWQGRGPVYRKVGRLVRYVESDVLHWLDAQSYRTTSQYSCRANASGLTFAA